MNLANPARPLLLRLPLILLVLCGALLGLWGAVQRIGWALPTINATLHGIHGPLMIGGVLGTLISLERAVALSAHVGAKALWAYAVPLLSGLGGLLLIVSGTTTSAMLLISGGSVGLGIILGIVLWRHPALYTLVLALGAGCWMIGNFLWLSGQPVYQVVHWWIGFLVLTIVSERLELSRVTRLSLHSKRLFMLATGIYLSGVLLTTFSLEIGIRWAGGGGIALALWLLRYDIVRYTVRKLGLTRYIAVCLLAGYVWLGIGGVFGVTFGAVYAGFYYDALLHAVLIGFVLSMIFGHAPIIIPAITGRSIQFSGSFYGYLLLAHGSLLLREVGDLTAWLPGRMWGGLLNVIAVLMFMGAVAYSILRAPKYADGRLR